MVLKVSEIALLGMILRGKGAIGGQTTQRGRKWSTTNQSMS